LFVKKYTPRKGAGAIYIFTATMILNIVLFIVLSYVDVFEISLLLKTLLVFLNIYQLYYLFLFLTMKYIIEDNSLKIVCFFGMKKVIIPSDQIEGYMNYSGKIRGVRLSGYATNYFAIGRAYVENAGVTYMYVTSSKQVVYINTKDMCYGLSPEDLAGFLKSLEEMDIHEASWKYAPSKGIRLFKDKKFTAIFTAASIVILIMTINPVLLYATKSLPDIMPLSFNAKYVPLLLGTSRQFAIQQMTYGFMNMAVLLCMFYASYFISKYDRKTAYKFISLPLVVSVIFLIMQLNIYLIYH